jgi:hypothetical protein
MDIDKESDEEKLFTGVLRLNAKIPVLILGLLIGSMVFLATNWLLIKGGHITPTGEYVVGQPGRNPGRKVAMFSGLPV